MKRTLTLVVVAALLAGCTAVGAHTDNAITTTTTTPTLTTYEAQERIKTLERQVASLKSLNSAVATKLGSTNRRMTKLEARVEALETRHLLETLRFDDEPVYLPHGVRLSEGVPAVLRYRGDDVLAEPLTFTMPDINGVSFSPSTWTWAHGGGSQEVTVTVSKAARPDGVTQPWALHIEPTVKLGDRAAVPALGHWFTVRLR
ncbi:MAG: hypothetical protein F4064_01155 [Acidimicrobiales bacterium]|nr:hypothetical protein [Acidimicrobiales bacterium]MYI26680.1 hypothetical protein [Acidimicrobiales bacterium]